MSLPQRDGADSSNPPYNEMTNDDLSQALCAVDQEKGLEADENDLNSTLDGHRQARLAKSHF